VSNYTIRHDEYGHATAIEREGYTVLHLLSGTERNEQEVEGIVRELNGVQRLRAALERIKKWADDPEPVTMLKIWNLANETLKGDENA